jgi:hypothetical protein
MADTKSKAQDAPKTTSKGVTPNVLAAALTERLGRRVTAKRVRSIARDYIERFGPERTDRYMGHVYSAAEVGVIADHVAGSGRGEQGASKAEALAMLADQDEA